jgi:hypothetical protein
MKAQVAVEFLTIFIIFIFVLLVSAYLSLSKVMDINSAKASLDANGLLDQLSGEIETASLEGPGFSARVELPDRLSGYDYAIRTGSDSLAIDYRDSSYLRHLTINSVTGSFAKGLNTISNVNGGVVIK